MEKQKHKQKILEALTGIIAWECMKCHERGKDGFVCKCVLAGDRNQPRKPIYK